MPPSASAYNAGLLALQQQQRARLTALIEQIDGTLAANWRQGVGAAASLYGPIIDQYAKDLAALRAANDDPAARLTLDWLTGQHQQLATIQASVDKALGRYADISASTVTTAQADVAQMAASDAAELTQRSLWPAVEGAGVPPSVLFNRPNPDAIAQWVGRAGNGHPLGDLFSGFGAEATQGARQAMMLGLLTGANPKAMAQGISQALGVSRSRATIIARTEVLGSYRSAAHETYRANSDVLSGWMWSAGGANPCFPAGTRIRMADGSEKPIEQVCLGDWVWTHRSRTRRVTGVMSHGFSGQLITFWDASNYRVTATEEHPFLMWYRGQARWIYAGRVKPEVHQHFTLDLNSLGEPLMRLRECSMYGEEVTQVPVFNLQVADDESYIANGFAVHNCAMCAGMDGQIFDLTESLDDHPCGKCAPIPITKSWDDILGPLGIDSSGIEETSMGRPGAYTSISQKFDSYSPAKQREIIGTKTGFEAYQRGEVTLRDFAGVRPAEDGWPASYYQKSLKELEIPTGRAGTPLVERSPRLTELERAGTLRARDFGAPIRPDEMPKWAQKSPASQAVYQIMRNGLPANMSAHELPLLAQNIEQMLTEDLSLNVRMAALRLQDMLKQYDEYLTRYVRNVTRGASTLERAPEFVYKPSKELDRALAAARAGERGAVSLETQAADAATIRETDAAIEAATGREATHIAPEDVAKWTANNAEGVPSIAYHYSTPEALENIRAGGIDLARSSAHAYYGNGFYMYAREQSAEELKGVVLGQDLQAVQLAIRMEHPFQADYNAFEAFLADVEKAHPGLSRYTNEGAQIITDELKARGYDGAIIFDTEADRADAQIIAFKPGTVRVIEQPK